MTRHWLTSSNRIVLEWLRCRRRPAGDGLTGLAVKGVSSGHDYRFPVLATTGDGPDPHLVVLPGHANSKSWWRNLDASGKSVEMHVLHRGTWRPASATVVHPVHPAYDAALATYLGRWPDAAVGNGPLVVIRRGVLADLAPSPVSLEGRR